jgi:very-short-patch-repair endonuclease
VLTPRERTERARALRRNSTDAEGRLWNALRGRQLGGAKFRRQVPIDRYFADFACVEARLVVEVDGSQHQAQVRYDAKRTEVIEAAGWIVMRVPSTTVMENLDGVAQDILDMVELSRNRVAREF